MNTLQSCPACESSRLFGLFNIRGSRSENIFKVKLCGSCFGLFHRSGYSETDEQLKKDVEWHVEMTGHDRYERIVDECLKLHPAGQSFLDIGCGVGNTLQLAKKKGLEVCGIEPNPYAVEYARTERALTIRNEYFDSQMLPKEYDIVVIDNVLEHLGNPYLFLQDVVNVISENGICYIAVPGNSFWILRILYSVIFQKAKRSIFYDAEVHINNFSNKSLVSLIKRIPNLQILYTDNGILTFRKKQ